MAVPSVVAVVALVPLYPVTPMRQIRPLDTPAYFTSAGVSEIPTGSVAMLYPFPSSVTPNGQAWQAVAKLSFKMPGGYFLVPLGPVTGHRLHAATRVHPVHPDGPGPHRTRDRATAGRDPAPAERPAIPVAPVGGGQPGLLPRG